MHRLNRRHFLRLGAGAVANTALSNPASGQNVSVMDFGADRTGHRDSTASVAAAIAHLITNGGLTLVFPPGTYRLASAQQAAISLTNRSNIEIEGSGSRIIMGNDALSLAFDRCSNLNVRNLTIDWDPLPYTQGAISDSGIGWFEVTFDAGFPAISGNGILAIESYDRSLRNIARGGLQVSGDKIMEVQATASNRALVRLAHVAPVPVGTVIVIRFKGNHDAVRVTQCQNVSFSGITLLSSHSMGYNVSLSNNLAFRQCTIGLPPAGVRLLSTNADGMHITNCSGSLTIDECIFEAMGDDAINVNAAMWRIQRQPSGGEPIFANRSGLAINRNESPGPRDQLEIMDPVDLRILTRGALDKLAAAPPNSIVSDASRVPTTTISGSQFRGNHSRAILAHAHLQVLNCSFQNTSLAAIMIAPDSHWMEGPATRDIVIDSNQFSGCHYGSLDPEGAVTVDIEQTYGRRGAVPIGTGQNVKISNNIFNDCYTAAISCRSVDGLTIQGNQIEKTWVGGKGGPAIQGSALRNSTISNNVSSAAANTIQVQNCESTQVAGNRGFLQAS
jgi:hypothetical protein